MKYFLVYIDILGFEDIAKNIAKEFALTPEEVRSTYRDRVGIRLKDIKEKGYILDFREISLDSWLLFIDNIWKVFKSIGEVLKSELSLEVAIGAKEFEDSPTGQGLITLRDETMSYLKDDIISLYKSYMKKQGKLVRETFILLTVEAYDEFDSKNICYKDYFVSKKGMPFYLVKQEEFKDTLKILEFLEKIGSQRKDYKHIKELYVEPKNYDEIKNILSDYNIVFIVGDPEIGKTYTAIKFLFEFFKKGYDPIYYPEESKREQWELIRHGVDLKGKVIYLEDPWGKVKFERVESLFRDIGDFIRAAKRRNCKVIITSREKVFKEFKKRMETVEDLPLSKLKVGLAYTKGKLNNMLENYINVFEPKWKNDENLRKIAFEAVWTNLRTPMSIKQFVEYTKEVEDTERLKAGIAKAAMETQIVFANEIKEMFNKGEHEKIVLLSCAYISTSLPAARECYDKILYGLSQKYEFDSLKAMRFDDLLEWFDSEVEIQKRDISLFGSDRRDYVVFSHPAYSEAFSFILSDNGKPSVINERIFSEVLVEATEYIVKKAKDEAYYIWDIARDLYWKRIISEDTINKVAHKMKSISEGYLI